MQRQISLKEKVIVWCRDALVEGQIQPIARCSGPCNRDLRPPRAVYDYIKRHVAFELISHWTQFELLADFPGVEYGHVEAYARGGPSVIDNIRLVCHNCNIRMGTKNIYTYCSQHNHVPIDDSNKLMLIDTVPRLKERMMTDDIDMSPNRCKGFTEQCIQCRKTPLQGLDYCHVHSGKEKLAK